jgi:SNF family Na+-dependent transporter/thymidylate synthase ThyX
MTHSKDQWGSRIGLVMAMAGNAVGFGNFLRFPIQAIQNGGGAFIIPYLVCFIFLGLPLVFIEWTMGRFGGSMGNHTVPFTMQKMGNHKLWKYMGALSFFTTIGIASYYCYLESWTISYLYHSLIGTFKDMPQKEIALFFNQYHDLSSSHSGIPYENIFAFLLCLFLNVYILTKGLKGGIEKVATYGIPLLIFFGIFLAIRGVTIHPGEEGAVSSGITGLNFLWTPQFDSLLNPKVWLAAAGQIFFTLSVGMGTIQCYSSYVKKNDDIALNAMSTSFVNEFVEIVLGGTILISISVGFFGIDAVKDLVAKEGGFGIAFQSMPFLFQKFGSIMGTFCGVAFFGLLFIAGITSSLGVTMPSRETERWLSYLMSSHLTEVFEIAKEIKTECMKVTPSLISHVTVNPLLNRRFGTKLANNINVANVEYFDSLPGEDKAPGVTLNYHSNIDKEVAFSLVEAVGYYSISSLNKITALDEIFELSLERSKFDEMPQETAVGILNFDIICDIGAFRDIQRHRVGTQINEMWTSLRGYSTPDSFNDPELKDLKDEYDSIFNEYSSINKDLTLRYSNNSEYCLLLGHNTKLTYSCDFRQFVYFVELRSGEAGHYSYRRIAQDMYNIFNAIYPELGKYIRVNLEGDTNRKSQEEQIEIKKSKLRRN